MKTTSKLAFKLALITTFISILSACGGGGDVDVIIVAEQTHAFLSVDNLNFGNGVVCVEDIFLEANSAQGKQVARDLVDFYGTNNFALSPIHQAYSAPTYCGGPTANFTPRPGTIVNASYYYNVIVPRVR